MEPQPHNTVSVFCSYAHKDEDLRRELENHLTILERQGRIAMWSDRKIGAGEEWKGDIDERLEAADVILLLISPDFIASDYCYDVEMKRAMRRHDEGGVCVIPILLRAVNWRDAPFGKLQPLPTNERPVTSWSNRDEAFTNIAEGIQTRLEEFTNVGGASPDKIEDSLPPPITAPIVDFVQRRDADNRDIAEYLTKELTPSGNKLVTLCGLGGVGKTTLAFEVARKWEKAYGGRVVWSDAERRADYSLSSLLDDIAKDLGRPDFVWLLRGIKKKRVYELVAAAHTLIVLDTYEIIAPDEQRRIKDWFKHPSWAALFVSREEIDKTLNITIPPMWRGEAEEFLERLITPKQDRQIFSDEIRERIYMTADGTPSLMEWIVGQIDAGEVPDRVFKDLKQGKGSAAERVFDRSFNLPQLGDDGRAALLALSLFKPSATREALAMVAGFPGDEERLRKAIGNLRRLKLIKGEEQNRRLRIEGLTLSMAAARLPKTKYALGIWQRFVTYFRDHTLESIRENSDAATTEKSNILRAMQVAPCIKDWDTVVELYDMTLDFTPSFYIHFYKAWKEAIELSEVDAEQKIKVKKQPLPIIIEINHRDKEKVRKHYEGIQEKLNSDKPRKKVVLSAAKFELGVFAYERGDYQLARKLFEKAEEFKRAFHDKFGAAIACNNLGVVIAIEGQEGWEAKARAKFQQALDTFRECSTSKKQGPRFAKWLAAVRDKILEALFISKRSSPPNKKGARFAQVVSRNLKWLRRLERSGHSHRG